MLYSPIQITSLYIVLPSRAGPAGVYIELVSQFDRAGCLLHLSVAEGMNWEMGQNGLDQNKKMSKEEEAL